MMFNPVKFTILIVDDEPANIKALGESLKSRYRVIFATDGEKALQCAKSQDKPDLILLDVVMLGLDGFEVCKRLKADPSTQNIPVIFLTSMSQEVDETKGFELGAVDYITKPFSLPIVHARVKSHLDLKMHRDLLEELSLRDGVTGLANRQRFDEFLSIVWKQAIRNESTISLILTDIDHYKSFNENYGHLVGTNCLKKIASTISKSVRRPLDFVARYRDDEFALVLPETNKEGAHLVAERIRKDIERLRIPHFYSPIESFVTASIGAATIIPARFTIPGALLTAAQKSLEDAKQSGRNTVISAKL